MVVPTNTRVLRTQYIPRGEQFSTDFVQSETIPLSTDLSDGGIIVRNLYLALDPYIRFSFENYNGNGSPLGQTVVGFGIGQVHASKNSAYPVGSIVVGFNIGWEEYTHQPNPQLFVIPDTRDPRIDLTEYTNALGINGLTAYAAVKTLVKFKKDQVVYISSAAGPVGTFFAILAKRAGAFVVGSAGTDDKVSYLLKEIGIDAAFNYKTKDSRAELDAIAPNGIDIYFDQVAGETLDIALEKLKFNGQVLAIGNISTVGAKTAYATKNLNLITVKALTINGFTAFQHLDKFPELWKEFEPLIARGEIRTQKPTVIEGVEHVGQAFKDYLDGKYHGKVIVKVADL
ncbi:MAG: hypothetical protein J3Q66DRAFT_439238 [Benniella sp.]|nr:MAG: hypothetical protein J3Q66DRAFT_439238 [Benniella sp.]